MLIIVGLGALVFLAVILVAFWAVTTSDSKLSSTDSLRAISSYTYQNDEIVVTEASMMDRIIAPGLSKLNALGRRFTPVGYIDNKRKILMHAGQRGPEALDKFMSMRVLTIGAIPFLWILFSVLPGLPPQKRFMIIVLATAIAIFYPETRLQAAARKRQKSIRRMLPDILDLLCISVEAGLGFEQAVDRITESVPGALSDEFNRMIGEMRAGSARSEALQGLELRTGVEEVKSFVLSMVQADTFGVSIGRVLRAQADEMRVRRRQLAQEAAQKAPVKMLLPMTFFIFPPLFIVVLGPAMINIATNFK